MNANEAYMLIQKFLKEKPEIIQAKEYPNYFGFFIAPAGTKGSQIFVGDSMICVNKKTKKVYWKSE